MIIDNLKPDTQKLTSLMQLKPSPIFWYDDFKSILPGIRKEVAQHAALFDQFTIRQDYKGSAHADTKTIFLRGPKGIDQHSREIDEYSMFHSLEFSDWSNRSLFPSVNHLINNVARLFGAKELGWITIVGLASHGFIEPHIDEGKYCETFMRFHYVIESDGAFFMVDKKSIQPTNGILFTYNNQEIHTAYNPSKNPRVHLIFDIN